MKTYQLECPSCGAKVNAENIEQRKEIHCIYCGNLIRLDDEVKRVEINIQKTYTNEARIKDSEVKERIAASELRYKEREQWRRYTASFGALLLSVAILAVCALFLYKLIIPEEDEVRLTANAKSYIGENYEQVVRELEDMGFTNVDTMRQEDLIVGWFTKDGEVAKVSINGDTDFEAWEIFPKDTNVVVTYHTFEEE